MVGESGYARVENDAYWTPRWCIDALLFALDLRGEIWDPACGNGAILKACPAFGLNGRGSDIKDYGFPETFLHDFLKFTIPSESQSFIITNPPYDKAEAFIRHALFLTERGKGLVAMLLRNEYDSAQSRRDLFADHSAFARKYVLTKRPKWFEDVKTAPRHNFSWFVWCWHNDRRPPQLRYLP